MIEIAIKKDQTADGTRPKTEDKQPGKPSLQQKAVNTALITAGKSAMMAGVKMYGELTGDYMLVNNINNAVSIAGDIAIIAAAGPLGALAVGTKYAIQIGNSMVAQVKADRENRLVQIRAGNLATKGSRYSND